MVICFLNPKAGGVGEVRKESEDCGARVSVAILVKLEVFVGVEVENINIDVMVNGTMQ